MLTVLIPHPMPERCYLSEAVLWVAINRIPYSFVTENNIEVREDYEYFDDMEPYVPDGGIITVEECEQFGLEPNPYWEEIGTARPILTLSCSRTCLNRKKTRIGAENYKNSCLNRKNLENVRRDGMQALKNLSTYVGTSCFCPLARDALER